MSPLTQSEAQEALRKSYGGSDNTRPSYQRPQYVQYNTYQKAKDFGLRDNLNTIVSGEVGGEVGAATLYYKVTVANPTDLRVLQGQVNERTDRFITVGISDSERRPLRLDESGYARPSDIYNTDVNEATTRQPAGTYYFTVSSSQWQALPFVMTMLAITYKELSGVASGSAPLTGRLALAKLNGAILGSNTNTATITTPGTIKALGGAAGGNAPASGSLAIPSGAAGGTLLLEGRLKQFHRISGSAGGTAPLTGTLTRTASGGGGGYG